MSNPSDREMQQKFREYEGAIAEKDAALMEAQLIIKKQDALLRKLTSMPNPYATVIQKLPGKEKKDLPKLVVFHDSRYMEVGSPGKDEKEIRKLFDGIKVGSVLKVTFDSSQPFDVVEGSEALGSIVMVRRVLDRHAEVEDSEKGGIKVVLLGDIKPEVGDRVLLDTNGLIIQRNLGKDERRFALTQKVCVPWESIGALGDAVNAIVEMIEDPFRYKDIFAKYGQTPPKGVLLYGPPGCGKTLIGKAIATAIARIFNEIASTGFLHVKGPEILSKWVGESEATIRAIFERCREHKTKHGYPAVLFIDEAEAILSRRGSGVSSDVEKTIVPMFLSEMDGLDDSGAIVVLATNRPDMLDPAVIREGRVDRKIRVGRPHPKHAHEIFQIHLKKKPLAEGVILEELAKVGASQLFDTNQALYEIEKKNGEKVTVTIGHVASGSMIATLVDKATSYALKRDIKGGTFKGVDPDNLVSAVKELLAEHRGMYHKDELDDLTADIKKDVKEIHKVKV